ncbi:MAG: NnrU family protein [candidate division Zixibacteria bacterium]|jgi:protein-S-isoprenylcysteine O-methyltransferase Ste14|nr:NnrU family protein [candidate division Zixibacteria bacterium]
MKRVLVFVYGVLTYVFFLGVFLYAIGFVGNILVPKSIDSGIPGPLGTAILINALLLGVFAIQHTIMARPAFKNALGRIIPAAAVRSTFVLAANLSLALIFWQWRPLGGMVWQVENEIAVMVLNALFWAGWLVVLIATFLINHFDLFGLRQVTMYLLQREPGPLTFKEHSLYKIIRHPIMLGFIIAFWAAPEMSNSRLFFAAMTTGYILVGLMFEERDLIRHHGERYRDYARRVPMLIPFSKIRRSRGVSGPKLEDEPAAG